MSQSGQGHCSFALKSSNLRKRDAASAASRFYCQSQLALALRQILRPCYLSCPYNMPCDSLSPKLHGSLTTTDSRTHFFNPTGFISSLHFTNAACKSLAVSGPQELTSP